MLWDIFRESKPTRKEPEVVTWTESVTKSVETWTCWAELVTPEGVKKERLLQFVFNMGVSA